MLMRRRNCCDVSTQSDLPIVSDAVNGQFVHDGRRTCYDTKVDQHVRQTHCAACIRRMSLFGCVTTRLLLQGNKIFPKWIFWLSTRQLLQKSAARNKLLAGCTTHTTDEQCIAGHRCWWCCCLYVVLSSRADDTPCAGQQEVYNLHLTDRKHVCTPFRRYADACLFACVRG